MMQQAPGFSLTSSDGASVSLKDLLGTKLVMFFYPAAMTPGCTGEACDFRDDYSAFTDAGYRIVGVSPDSPDRNAAFKEKHHLPFTLLSDPNHVVAEAFGAWGLKKNYGREYEGLIRSTFVIDADGTILHELRNVRAKGHVDRLKATLELG
jgi:peroxiredoxin Q/BCP